MRAQWEIREVARAMLDMASAECPTIFEGAGPKCLRLRGCPEGGKGCDRYEEMREQYGRGEERSAPR